jgi:hypothetical protein
MEFGHFASKTSAAVAENLDCIHDTFGNAVRGFVENDGAVLDAKAFESTVAFPGASREKADKEKLFVGKAGGGEGSEKRGRAGYRDYRNLVAETKRHEAVTGIGNQGHSRVTDEGNLGALFQGNQEFRRARHFVVLVIADQGLVDIVVSEKFLGVAGVFASDLIGFLQNAQGAKSNVLEVADRRADEIEAARGG